MIWPVPGNTLISQYFGENKSPLYASLGLPGHNGLDIPCDNGTDVLAATEGRVRDIIEEVVGISGTRGRGISILSAIENNQYTETIYWHLQDFIVQSGDTVKAGQVIAHSDNTGQSSGPHLHFGVRFFDKNFAIINEQNGYKGFVNPLDYVKPSMTINQDELSQLYLAVFGRLPDDQAQGYVGKDLLFVLNELMKSPEYQAYASVLDSIQHHFNVKL